MLFQCFDRIGIGGWRPMPQPRRGGSGRSAKSAPDEVATMLGPGQRHIEQSDILGQPLDPRPLPMGLVVGAAQVTDQSADRLLVEENMLLSSIFDARSLEEKWAEDHGVFQPLALM